MACRHRAESLFNGSETYVTAKRTGLLDELTARECEVLELVAQGLDNGTIGARLGISERTARNHVPNILGKLGINSRAQAIVRARDAGFGQNTL